MKSPTLYDLDLSSAQRISHYRYIRNDAPIHEGWTDDGPCPGHHGNWSRMATLAEAQQETLAMADNVHAETSTGFAVGNEFPNATGHIDPMATFAEVPRMLPTFSTRNRLRMIYVDSHGRQKALDLKVADLTRIMHSAAVALESLTREQTMVEKIDALADEIMGG
jgi:hypothetical protein